MKIGIVGLGLIGGSIAKDLKGLGHEIIGYDKNPSHLEMALELGLISESMSLELLAKQSEAIFVSVPVGNTGEVIIALLECPGSEATVIDTASTKMSICKMIQKHPKRKRYVACHPAGRNRI